MKRVFVFVLFISLVSGVWVACSSEKEEIEKGWPPHTEGYHVYEKKWLNEMEGPVVVFVFKGNNILVDFYDLEFKGRPRYIKTIRKITKSAEGMDSLNVIFEPFYAYYHETALDSTYYEIYFLLDSDSISHVDKMYLKCSNNGYSYDGLVSLTDNDDKGWVEIEMHKNESFPIDSVK